MPIAIKPNGEFEVIYSAPFTGVNVVLPENQIPDSATPLMNDFMLWNGEIRSRIQFSLLISSPVPTPPTLISGLGAFNGVTPVSVATNTFYTYSYGGGAWTNRGAGTAVGTALRTFAGILYITGGAKHLASWDGVAFVADNAQDGGGNKFGGTFLGELDNHLIMLNTLEGAGAGVTIFPNRVRWSATSLPAQWDVGANINAGFTDLLDVPDSITGFLSLGRVGYIIRHSGITEMAPTGQGAAPFQFNHLWANEQGIGGVKWFGTAEYGNTGVIIARDNIYRITSFDVEPIGGAARDAIYADLGLSNTNNGGGPWAVITPYLRSTVIVDTTAPIAGAVTGSSMFGLMYMLFINIGVNDSVVWVCRLENNNSWEKYNLPTMRITSRPAVLPDSNQAPVLAVPVFKTDINQSAIYSFNPDNKNETAQASSYKFRAEEVIPGRQVTVRRVILTYKDLGVATITASISVTDDTPSVQTVTAANVSIGTVGATGALMTKPIDIAITGFRPQLTISRAAGAGAVSLITVQMFGTAQVGSEF